MITAVGTGIGKNDFNAARLRYITDHHDGCGRGWLTYPHAAVDVLLPPHAGADHAWPRICRAAKKGKSEKYIKDDREFTLKILRRAIENVTVEYGTGEVTTVEKGELRAFLMKLDELQACSSIRAAVA